MISCVRVCSVLFELALLSCLFVVVAVLSVVILKGECPQLPSYCPPKLRHFIERCWSQGASKRPRFGEICVELRHLKCLLLMSCNMVDTEKEAAVQELQSTGVQPSSDFSPKSQRPLQHRVPVQIPRLHRMMTSRKLRHQVPIQMKEHHPIVCQIYLIGDWPGNTSEKRDCKTLTALYYKPTEHGHLECASWGYPGRLEYNMDHRHGPPRGGPGLYLTKFQALLNDRDLARSIPAPLMATGIITDYLKLIG